MASTRIGAERGRPLALIAQSPLPEAMSRSFNAHGAVDQLAAIYDEFVANLRRALARYVEDRTPPDARGARRRAASPIPSFAIDYAGQGPVSARRRAPSPGSTSPAPTRPASPGPSCSATISSSSSSISIRDYDVDDLGRPLGERNPLPLCDREQRRSRSATSARPSCRASSRRTSWSISATRSPTASGMQRPTSRGRWRCSTGRGPISAWRGCSITPARRAEHFQQFVLFTNYVRYVDEFVGVAIDALRRKDCALHRAVGARRASTSRAS